MNSAPAGLDPERDLPSGFWRFYLPLHQAFTARQQELLRGRHEALAAAHRGQLPDHLPASAATTGDWRISLPAR